MTAKTKPGFQTTWVNCRTQDGRHIILTQPMVYVTNAGETITVPVHTTSDGASTPRFLWLTIPPFGTYWMAAVLHDYLYRLSNKPKDYCDNILYEAMKHLGVEDEIADAIYEGVHLGGQSSFNHDRKVATKDDLEKAFHFMGLTFEKAVEIWHSETETEKE